MVGKSNETHVYVNGKKCKSLIDSGSMVSTISEPTLRYLHPVPTVKTLDEFILSVRVAEGSQLPYHGYVEVNIKVPFHTESMMVPLLVVPETDYNRSVPVIIGTNVLRPIKSTLTCDSQVNIPREWKTAFSAMDASITSLVKSTNRRPIKVSPMSIMTVTGLCKTKSGNQTAVTECLDDNQGSLGICPRVVSLKPTGKSRVPVRIFNMTAKAIYLKPRSVICGLNEVKIVRHADLDSSDENTESSKKGDEQDKGKILEKLGVELTELTPEMKEIRNKILEEWRYVDKKYVTTSATIFILKSLENNRGVIITGSPGCGKSAAAHHVALELEKKGYEICQCNDPLEIIKHFKSEKIQVFVIDDVCGKFALNHQKADLWEQSDTKLNRLMERCNQNYDNEETISKYYTKFILTCRENIYVHNAFPKLSCFSLEQCSYSTKFQISKDEMMKIALSYLPENIVNSINNVCLYDFFPLICAFYCKMEDQDPLFFNHPVKIIQREIDKMKTKSKASFICFALLVLKNNILCKCELRSEHVDHLVKEICKDSGIESSISIVAVENCFNRLQGYYFAESNGFYTAIHDKMFDIISAAIAPSIMNCLIEHVDIAFLANRIEFLLVDGKNLPFVIYIPPNLERIYLQRQYKEAMKGKYWEVFGSMQTENYTYRRLLLSFLIEQDTCQHMSYVAQDDGSTPLFVSASLGYVDFVRYFLVKCSNHINVKDREGRSSFHVACENGHIAIVKYLLKFYEDINAEKADKTTALSATCINGHTEVAKLLLDNNADINRKNKLNQHALYFACLNGSVELVSLLINHYKVALTNRDTREQIPVHTTCQDDHIQSYKHLFGFCSYVNTQTDFGWTSLYIACFQACLNGHYETVNILLNLNGQKSNSCMDTRLRDEDGWSVLHAACSSGHTEVVKLLIKAGVDINIESTNGSTPFFLACIKGSYNTVKFLLDLNGNVFSSIVNITIKDQAKRSALHAACNFGHLNVLKLLIDEGMNVNDTADEFLTPLYFACQKGHFDIVKFLLDLNGNTLNSIVDTSIKGPNERSVLHVACYKGHTDIVKLLLDIGMNVGDKSNAGTTPLYLACLTGRYEIVKFIFESKSTVDTTTKTESGFSILHTACVNGHTEVVKLLIEVGMNVNDTTNNGLTPLYLACGHGHYDTVKHLLDFTDQNLKSSNDIIINDIFGWSALHSACSNGHTKVVKLLIDNGMTINDTTTDGYTPFFLACFGACQQGSYDAVVFFLGLYGITLTRPVDTLNQTSGLHIACDLGHTDIAKLLIDAGTNIDYTTHEGFTYLNLVCSKGHYDIVKYILDFNKQRLKNHIDSLVQDTNGQSVLHVACSNGHTKVVKLLIDVGMNVNDTSNIGLTPFYLCCAQGHHETVKILLDLYDKIAYDMIVTVDEYVFLSNVTKMVNTTAINEIGSTALHIACLNGHTDVVKLLVDFGMNINNKTKHGFTPLYLACQKGRYETVKFLLDLNCRTSHSQMDIPKTETDVYRSLHSTPIRVNTTSKDPLGSTALHVACSNGHSGVANLLINVGMDVNARRNDGKTALHLASLNGHDDIVNILKNSGTQIDMFDYQPLNPSMIAEQHLT
ncbi:Hypothetical predicted protein [Mytilus galloprovincialis]|uniref:Novel STAND NTPase 3 domain-containing protein n=1 Tax=Mytilus galloprovincialis TaxID=29158 RepID=A0A8B6CE72_MYTGA|nr:Hypothetical predicted protein [Mytilus galloprovincialis]